MHDYQTPKRQSLLRRWQRPAFCRFTLAIIGGFYAALWALGTVLGALGVAP